MTYRHCIGEVCLIYPFKRIGLAKKRDWMATAAQGLFLYIFFMMNEYSLIPGVSSDSTYNPLLKKRVGGR